MDTAGLVQWAQSQLPGWTAFVVLGLDLAIRVIALGTIPYRRKPEVALGWLMLIFLFPFLGLLVYLFLGSPKLPLRRREKQHEINQLVKEEAGHQAIVGKHDHLPLPLSTSAQLNYELGALPMVHGNDFTLLQDSSECIRLMKEAAERAVDYVHFEFYIVALDQDTQGLIEAMLAAHRRGVRVRILVDHVGSLGYPGYKQLVRMLDESGVPWRRSLPIRPWRGEYQRPDLRNHRKIFVVDGEVAYTGSQNVIHPSYNKRANLRRGLRWKDLMVECRGPVVDELNAVFASDWYSETDDILFDEFERQLDLPDDGGMLAQVVPSGPGFEQENNIQLFTHLIYNANESVVVCSPYFVPDTALLTALKTESQSGVAVRLYVGATSDHWVTAKAQESYYDELVEAGVEIYQYHAPTVLHSKFMIVDDQVTVIGSSNMDQRSFSMNHEVSLFVIDRDFAAQMYELEEQDYRAHSAQLNPKVWRQRSMMRKYIENVCRLTSSLL
ncbi:MULTISPECIES: cardiolipin synthase [Brevibacterium]|uniref:Cardiolipin synthase n=1 Tax=Brevibacterium salitolerans TaxID=1403566 RepID=A0ABN2WPU9_9MICO|nr:cardiolipin synthase [Brevibacterium sp.]